MKIVRVYTTPATILAATSAALTNTKLSAVKMTTANSLNHGKLFASNNTQKYFLQPAHWPPKAVVFVRAFVPSFAGARAWANAGPMGGSETV